MRYIEREEFETPNTLIRFSRCRERAKIYGNLKSAFDKIQKPYAAGVS